MPIYEYTCPKCRKRWSKLWPSRPSPGDEVSLRCRTCGTGKLERVFSPFATSKSDEERLDSLVGGSALAGLDGKDPKSLARFMRKMSDETGEPLDAEEREMLERMESGEMPEEEGRGEGGGGGGDEFL